MKYKNLICVPAYNGFEYTKKLLKTILLPPESALFLINNGSEDETRVAFINEARKDGVFTYDSEDNLGAAGSWNRALDLGFVELKVENVLLLNNDILLLPDTLKIICNDLKLPEVGLASAKDRAGSLVSEDEFFRLTASNIGSCSEKPDFSCFGINKKCFEKVGYFDEAFYPAYFEDNDYHFRMRGEGLKAICNFSNYYWHYGSRSRLKDERFLDYIKYRYMLNGDYYVRKWGGSPGGERFISPFDGLAPDDIKIVEYKDYKNEVSKMNL